MMTLAQMKIRIAKAKYRPRMLYNDGLTIDETWEQFKQDALGVVGLTGNPHADLLFVVARELGVADGGFDIDIGLHKTLVYLNRMAVVVKPKPSMSHRTRKTLRRCYRKLCSREAMARIEFGDDTPTEGYQAAHDFLVRYAA